MKNTHELLERLVKDMIAVAGENKCLSHERLTKLQDLLFNFQDPDKREEVFFDLIAYTVESQIYIVAHKEKRRVSKQALKHLYEHIKKTTEFDEALFRIYNNLNEYYPEVIVPDKGEQYGVMRITKGPTDILPVEIVNKLDETVIGNTNLKRGLAVHLVKFRNQQKFSKSYKPQHLIITGETGTGKTYTIEQICKLLEINLRVIDCSRITPAGYKGYNLSHALNDVIMAEAHNRNMEDSDDGIKFINTTIIMFDEFDKLIYAGKDGFDAQGEFLKLLEGRSVTIDSNNSNKDGILWNLSNVMFIFAGAFSKTSKSKVRGKIGFSTGTDKSHALTLDQVMAAGLLSELAGRIGRVMSTELLEDWRPAFRVEGGVREYYNNMFSSLGIDKTVSDEDEDVIITNAKKRHMGLRGLQAAADEYFEKDLFI